MEYRTINGLKPVSALSLGSWMTWENMEERDARAVIESGLSAGINFLDDARYNDRTGHAPMKTGYSEVLFGRMLRDLRCDREQLIVANKLWFEFFPQESVEAELDGSLSRLQMDYLDIVYCAEVPQTLPLPALIETLDRLITTGKLRAWGVLNWPAAKLAEAIDVAARGGWRPPTAAQLAYSAVSRSPVEDAAMQPVYDAGVQVVASYSLEGGLLSGKYLNAAAAQGRLRDQKDDPRLARLLPAIEPFVAVSRELGCTPAQLAIAYCLTHPHVASVLFGATRIEQMRDNLGALQVLPRLTSDVLARLRRL